MSVPITYKRWELNRAESEGFITNPTDPEEGILDWQAHCDDQNRRAAARMSFRGRPSVKAGDGVSIIKAITGMSEPTNLHYRGSVWRVTPKGGRFELLFVGSFASALEIASYIIKSTRDYEHLMKEHGFR